MSSWISFFDIDLSDPEIKQCHIDTRDFYCIYSKTLPKKDIFAELPILKFKKSSNTFFFTAEEATKIITRLYNESGKDKTWRYLTLKQYKSWLKYIRIYRHKEGFLICDRKNYALGSHRLNSKIIKLFQKNC